jgi:hypothetical protein
MDTEDPPFIEPPFMCDYGACVCEAGGRRDRAGVDRGEGYTPVTLAAHTHASGYNIHMGAGSYMNFGCTVLDAAK